jgi:hypothetical protein
MSNNRPRAGRRPLRGETLDQALTRELEGMIAEGAAVSPISLAAVGRRLALGSRTTLYEPARLERIRAARMRQKQSLRAPKSVARSGDGNASSKSDLQQLRRQLNELRGYVVQIAINAHRMGLQPDLLLSLSQREMKTAGTLNAEHLAIQYLSSIGLLAKLDTNVRGLAR